MKYFHKSYACLVILLMFSACDQDVGSFDEAGQFSKEQTYQLNALLKGEPPAERSFVDVSIDRTVTLPATDDVILFNPAAVWYLEDGQIYIWDAGDFRIKAFTDEGRFVGMYGNGRGEGPGQFSVSKTFGLHADSLFLLDPQFRRLSWFHMDGSIVQTKQFEERVHDYTLGSDGTEYRIYVGAELENPYARLTDSSGEITQPQALQGRDVSSIVFDGKLRSTPTQGIYILWYYPVLLAFAPGDSLARAYPTPDYGAAPLPEPRIAGEGFSQFISPPENRLHWGSQINGETLAVQIRPREAGVALFDIYHTESLTYRYTVRVSVETNRSAHLAYDDGLLITRADTSVAVHHLAHDHEQN